MSGNNTYPQMKSGKRDAKFHARRQRVDIVIPEPNGDRKVSLFADSLESAMLLQSWIFKTLPIQRYQTSRQSLSGQNYILDARSVHDVNVPDEMFQHFVTMRNKNARCRLVLVLEQEVPFELEFLIATFEDMNVFRMYLDSGLRGSGEYQLNCYCRANQQWKPYTAEVFVRKDYADLLLRLSPENAAKLSEYAERLLSGDKRPHIEENAETSE